MFQYSVLFSRGFQIYVFIEVLLRSLGCNFIVNGSFNVTIANLCNLSLLLCCNTRGIPRGYAHIQLFLYRKRFRWEQKKQCNNRSQCISLQGICLATHSSVKPLRNKFCFIRTEIFWCNRVRENPIRKCFQPITMTKRLSHTWEKHFVQSQCSCQNYISLFSKLAALHAFLFT